ncbi:MAG TPA: hypothetical protein VEU96_33085 [Bryobacteraceae bacterium]|nr:hypothetical protein [Bryobacteraceae bacterium]
MRRFASLIHWAARLAALLVTGTFLLLLAGEFVNPHSGPPTHLREWAGIGLLIAAIIGMLAAWKWELPGALLSLLTLVAFVPVVGMHRYDVVGFAAIPGILYLGDWLLRDKARKAVLR